MYELNQEFEINFKELAVLLVKRIWIAIIAAILCGAIGTVYASSFITPMYNSRARLYIIGSQNTGVFSPSELSAYENLTRDYLNLIKSRTILEAVIESNDLNAIVSQDILKYIREDDKIHLTEAGIEVCAKQVVKVIKGE